MIRKRLFDELDAVAQGRDPKAVIRSANLAKCVELPYFQKKESVEGIALEEYREVSVAEGAPRRPSGTATASRRKCAAPSSRRWA